jgi:hypothetical protein
VRVGGRRSQERATAILEQSTVHREATATSGLREFVQLSKVYWASIKTSIPWTERMQYKVGSYGRCWYRGAHQSYRISKSC